MCFTRARPLWSVFGSGLLLVVMRMARAGAAVVDRYSVPPNAGCRGSPRERRGFDVQQQEVGGLQDASRRGFESPKSEGCCRS